MTIDRDGKYSVLLGAATESGLPQTVFAAGQARWLGISIERAPEESRVPLASVAYAMKAADAETLGGMSAGEFVTREQLHANPEELAAQGTLLSKTPNAVHTNGSPTGSGVAGAIPLWTKSTLLGSSLLTQSGKTVTAKGSIVANSDINLAGVTGTNSAKSGLVTGVNGVAGSTTQFSAGVNGSEKAVTGEVFGVEGSAASTTTGAAGVWGNETGKTGDVYGVVGSAESPQSFAAGVLGNESSLAGQVFGVWGKAASSWTQRSRRSGHRVRLHRRCLRRLWHQLRQQQRCRRSLRPAGSVEWRGLRRLRHCGELDGQCRRRVWN